MRMLIWMCEATRKDNITSEGGAVGVANISNKVKES